MINIDPKKIDELLNRGVQDVLPSRDALRAKLLSGKKLKIYLGIDPTSPLVHIGHISTFNKLRQFQELGHEVVVLVGDFTAIAGDPDKTETRNILSDDQIKENMETYKSQISKIINFEGENAATFVRNSEWLSKLDFRQVLELASKFTVQQMLERDNFQKRIANQTPIRLHEFLYPLMQGYDSVSMNVDVELGGNDQLFNMMAGRTLMREMNNKEKFVVTGKLITDSSGKKIGKTDGNAWSLSLKPIDVFGKIMANPDGTIIQCFEQLTNMSLEDIEVKRLDLENGINPMELKKELAHKIVSQYYSEKDADQAKEYFEKTFQEKDTSEVKEARYDVGSQSVSEVIVGLGFASSKTQAKSLIEQGAVEMNGKKVETDKEKIENNSIFKVGKKNIVKLIFDNE